MQHPSPPSLTCKLTVKATDWRGPDKVHPDRWPRLKRRGAGTEGTARLLEERQAGFHDERLGLRCRDNAGTVAGLSTCGARRPDRLGSQDAGSSRPGLAVTHSFLS